MKQKLYVEKLQFDQGELRPTQVSKNLSNIQFNCRAISKSILPKIKRSVKQAGYSTGFVTAGKYFCVIALHDDEKKSIMLFTDLKKNDEHFYQLLGQVIKDVPIIRDKIMDNYQATKQDAASLPDDIQIVEGLARKGWPF